MTRVLNFSGGPSSGLMTLMLNVTPDDIVLFTDTKREHPKTYKFLNDFEAHEGIKIHRATYTHPNHPGLEGFEAFLAHEKYIPSAGARNCTKHLKIITAKKYLNSIGIKKWDNYIGFRFDEFTRVRDYRSYYKCANPIFYLYNEKIDHAAVDSYWLKKPYRLELLSAWKNCDFCFLKGKNMIIKLMQADPDGAQKWIEDEKRSGGGTYLKDITYAQLFAASQQIQGLFPLENAIPEFNCTCTN